MPRYFFHVYNDDVTIDEEGQELVDEKAACIRGMVEARLLAADSVTHHGHLILDHRIEIADEAGAVIATVRFGDAVAVRESLE